MSLNAELWIGIAAHKVSFLHHEIYKPMPKKLNCCGRNQTRSEQIGWDNEFLFRTFCPSQIDVTVRQNDTTAMCWLRTSGVKADGHVGWLRTALPAGHCEATTKDKTTSWWSSVSCPHPSSLTSTNRYTTCGDSIRKPLATDRLWANCCLGGIQKREASVYKDKSTPWNPSPGYIFYKDSKLSYTALSRLPLLKSTSFTWISGRLEGKRPNKTTYLCMSSHILNVVC